MAQSNLDLLSKDAIAARMFRNAARNWNIPDADIENFDPLVKMLIEACAVELYRVSNEIITVQEKMLEKLARLLTPQIYTAPKPAHCIIHARSAEPESIVYPYIQFVHKKRVASKQNGPLDTNLNVFFSPVGNYKAVNGDIKYIAYNNSLLSINNDMYKEVVFNTMHNKRIDPYNVWIGLDLHKSVKTLSGLSFFFDFRNYPKKQELFVLIQYSKWFINNKPVEKESGLWDAAAERKAFESFSGFDEFDLNQHIERQINNFYNQQFITIKNGAIADIQMERYPPQFENLFAPGDLLKLKGEFLWINLKFLPEFDENVLDLLMVSINSFPVSNRHLNEKWYRLQNNFNIIPLLTTEQFLSIRDVQGAEQSGDGGNKYVNTPFDTKDITQKGTFTLRSGDIERFDSRNAIEYMNYLLELLRDESRAFAALGQDFVISLIRELNQNIAQIEQKVKQNISYLNQAPTYLLINPRTEGENIFVEFWTTTGEAGNSLKSGTKLDLYMGAELQRETLVLLTNTTGGADKLKNTEILSAYKNIVMTRGRIVTLEDVKNYCNKTLGAKAQNVTVEKGVAVSPLPDEGLVNAINIKITADINNFDKEEWEAILHDLKVALYEQSAVWANYFITLESNQ